jgi:hypothetical protein
MTSLRDIPIVDRARSSRSSTELARRRWPPPEHRGRTLRELGAQIVEASERPLGVADVEELVALEAITGGDDDADEADSGNKAPFPRKLTERLFSDVRQLFAFCREADTNTVDDVCLQRGASARPRRLCPVTLAVSTTALPCYNPAMIQALMNVLFQGADGQDGNAGG